MLFDQLREDQKIAVDLVLEKRTVALFARQRTGKTWITIAVIEFLMEKYDDFIALIVGPLTNIESTWASSLARDLPGLRVFREYDIAIFKQRGPRLLLMHYEAFHKHTKKLMKKCFNFIVVDESQRIKDRASLASRRIAQMRDCAEYKLILSGTPVDKSPGDTWAQFRFVAPFIFGTKWSDFERRYLIPCGWMDKKRKFRWSQFKHFMSKIKPYSMTITEEQVGIQKPKIIWCPVKLGAKEKRYYDQMKADSVIDISGREIAAQLTITRNIKLHQICGGFIIDEDKNYHSVGGSKAKKLRSLIHNVELPVVIFCRYKPEIIRLKKMLSGMFGRVEVLWGKVKDKKNFKARTNLLNDFQSGLIDILICQTRTGGVGVDLYLANNAIIYSTGHSFIDYDQLFARLNHMDKKRRVRFFIIFAQKTVDEDIYSDLLSKRSTTRKILSPLVKRKKKWLPEKLPESPRRPRSLLRNRKRRRRKLSSNTASPNSLPNLVSPKRPCA